MSLRARLAGSMSALCSLSSLCCRHLVLGYVGLTLVVAAQGPRPTIRIAHLYTTDETFIPIEFMMDRFNTTNRSILPDFDVVVQPMPYEGLSGGASVRVVEALMAKEPFHAITGPWLGLDCLDTVDLTAQARILHVIKGENAEFTFMRERYPYVFRVFRSIDGIIHSWMYMVARNAWFFVLSIWSESATIEIVNRLVPLYNITNFAILAEYGEDWRVEAWQNSAVRQIRQHRLRVVMTYLATPSDMYRFVCHVHRSSIVGLQYFVQGTYFPGWFVSDYPEGLGTCTADEVYVAVGGHIATLHTPVAPGVNYLTINAPPVYGDDQSQRSLTCMPDTRVQDFYSDGELLERGILGGEVYDLGTGQRFVFNSGSETDMVCASLLALHDAIYRQGVDVKSIEQREPAAFDALLEAMSKVYFQGPAGDLRFYPNSGDPEVIYYAILQQALPHLPNNSAQPVAVFAFPNGRGASPELVLLNETHGYEPNDFVWRDGGTGLGPRPHLARFPDCREFNAELVLDSCEPCAPGRAFDASLDGCRMCSPGDFQNLTGSSACMTSQPGWYVVDTTDPKAVSLCPHGHECPQAGTVTPQPCQAGRFGGNSGLSACRLCPKGRYQPVSGSTFCRPCQLDVKGSTTANIASTSAAQCVCPEGTLRPDDGRNECVGCPSGMRCPEGSDMMNLNSLNTSEVDVVGPYPLVERGYMSLTASPLKIYLCRDAASCPGGGPGSCAARRDATTVACGDCVQDTYEDGSSCSPCGDAGLLPILLAAIAVPVLVAVVVVLSNIDVHRLAQSSLMIATIIAMIFTHMQALGLFHHTDIPWREPMKSLLRVAFFFNFDLKFLKVSCVMGVHPLRAFAGRQAVPVLAVPLVGTALLLKNYIRRQLGETQHRSIAIEATNSLGTLFSLCFISIFVTILDPFICYRHPDGNGESVVSAPSLLCFESRQHTSMLIISLLALIVIPLPFFTACGYGILQYPKRIHAHDSSAFLHAFRFLFLRYSPRCYYFHAIFLARGCLLCLIPAIFRGQPSTQVLCMCSVLAANILSLAQLRPWRSSLCNPLDTASNLLLSVILTAGGLFLDDEPQRDTVAWLSFGAFLLLVLLICCGLAVALQRRFMPRPFYDFFICHHKAHAAAQARFVKILLKSKSPRCHVFLDADNLTELGTLFDIVRSRVRKFLLYLTADTLRRPWCAGEIVSAYRSGVAITSIVTPSFAAPPAQQMEAEGLEAYIDQLGCNLSEYGIQWAHIAESYHYLLTLSKRVEWNSQLRAARRFEGLACAILQLRPLDEASLQLEFVPQTSILISSDPESDEASASAGILGALLNQPSWQSNGTTLCVLANYEYRMKRIQSLVAQAPAVIIILTGGCLQNVHFMVVMCELQRRQQIQNATIGVSVHTPDFTFPSAAVYSSVVNIVDLKAEYGSSTLEFVESFFKNISIALTTHASQNAIEIQAAEVMSRLKIIFKRAEGGGVHSPFLGSPFVSKGSNRMNSQGSSPGADMQRQWTPDIQRQWTPDMRSQVGATAAAHITEPAPPATVGSEHRDRIEPVILLHV